MPTLPIVGSVDKSTMVVSVAALAAVGGYALYKHNKNKKAAQQATAAQDQYGYGTAASMYGYGAPTYQPYGYGYGPYGLGSYGYGAEGNYFGYGYYGAGIPGAQSPVPQQATTNAQWSQAAVSALTAQGYNGQQVLGALGIYLTGGNLDDNQTGIVQAAIAAEGYPPVNGPGGFPPQWHSGGGGGGSGQGGGNGSGGGGGGKPAKVSGLTANQLGPGLINANWRAVPGATSYEFQASPPDEAAHDIGDRTGYNAGNLKPGFHTIRVAAKNANGTGPFATKRVMVKGQQEIPGGPEIPAK